MDRLFCRIGDGDDYHEVAHLDEFVGRLEEMGVCYPVFRYCRFGLRAEGFRHQNYISAYYGPNFETPVNSLTDEEIAYLNDKLERLQT